MFVIAEILGADGDWRTNVHDGASGSYMFGGNDVAHESAEGTLCLDVLASMLRYGAIEAIEVPNRRKWYFGPESVREFEIEYDL